MSKLAVRKASKDQYIIENYGPYGDFDKEYFAVSGYFGDIGPHVFASAPELLEALRWAMDDLSGRANYTKENPRGDLIMKAFSAIAKAEGKA